MNTYNIYKHPTFDVVEAVKVGFSWPALFFNFFWMVFKGLWGCAGYYFASGIVLSQLEKLSGNGSSGIMDYSVIIGYLAMLLVPGFWGNKWRSNRLKKNGYQFVDRVRSESAKGAVAQVAEEYVGIFEAGNVSEVMVVKSILESEDVPYKVVGEALNSVGVLPGPAKVFVPAEEVEKVSQLLRQGKLWWW